jgi:23S rRNA pseudouridine955/2504/2580 synthase
MSSKEADELRSRILFLNDEVIVINKPAGVSTQGGTKTARHIDGMLDALQFDAPEAPRLVHRLDKDVSGCLVLARTKQAAQSLGEMFQKREDTITKVYWAALSGRPRALEGRIKMSLSREARMVDGVQKVVPEDDPSSMFVS